jgi:hypothetical protein
VREEKMTRGSKSMRWRAVSILVLGLLLGSVGSGVGVAAQKGLTKKKADKKFLQNTTVVQQTGAAGGTQAVPMSVNCPPGFQAVGGGADSPAVYTGGSDAAIMFESRPVQSGARSVGWYVEVIGVGTGQNVTVYAVCSK